MVMDSAVNREAVKRLILEEREQIVCVVSSTRAQQWNILISELTRHLNRSGFRILSYLGLNFTLPLFLGACLKGARKLLPYRLMHSLHTIDSLCQQVGIPVIEAADIMHPTPLEALSKLRPELLVTFHFDQILPKAVLDVATIGGINIHPSLLPEHRGPIPSYYALAEAPTQTGVTIHTLDEGIDTGRILWQQRIEGVEGMSATGLSKHLHECALEGLRDVLFRVRQTRRLNGTPQTKRLPYCPFPDKESLKRYFRAGKRLVTWADLKATFLALRTPSD